MSYIVTRLTLLVIDHYLLLANFIICEFLLIEFIMELVPWVIECAVPLFFIHIHTARLYHMKYGLFFEDFLYYIYVRLNNQLRILYI